MRAILIVLDSVGIGHAPDATDYGDAGSDTLGHILETVPTLALPNLNSIGLEHSRQGAAGAEIADNAELLTGTCFAWMSETAKGKDTTSGHWEIAGAVLDDAFATFKKFPPALIEAIESEAGVHFIGNYPQSGITVLEELGEQHQQTGHPIIYTSADSVLQIAAHEGVVPLEKLYSICEIARRHVDRYRIGRVIARPFVGKPGAYERTSNRRDFSFQPPETILNQLQAAGIKTTGVGKISDIFAGSGIDESFPTKSNDTGMEAIDRLWSDEGHQGFTFVNLVDFDMHFGHRRDPQGYANCLAEFDSWLGTFLPKLSTNGDELLMITADHGNDPTWSGTDHTREQVPLLTKCGSSSPRNAGQHDSFAAVAAQLSHFFEI
ncbi:MAG: phosphopentomutase [Pseudoalteromonas tetraodonis]|jgi:phosphopentomutase